MAALNNLSRAPEEEHEVAGPAVASPVAAPHVARVLALQRSAGNAAVSRMLAREPAAAAPAATAPGGPEGAPGAASPIADLARRAGSPAALRAMVAADPSLAQQIAAYFATGAQDAALNDLMAQAFPAPAAQPADESGQTVGKNPTDPAVALPAPITNDKKLDKGQMKWTLKAASHTSARCDIDFKPDETKVEAKAVSFGQTVIQKVGDKLVYPGDSSADIGKNKPTFQPFEEAGTKKRMDHIPGTENDPFYGAEWDQAAKRWKKEAGGGLKVGTSTKGTASTSAAMNDTPNLPMAREGKGDVSSEFEAVPMVLETRQPLGALKWGFKVKDEANAPIELTGGQAADATDTPSADWTATMDQFYAGKYEEILDDFDIGKADLKPDHKTKLDNVVTKLKANVALKAQLGGAADLTGDPAFNQALSLKRAQAAKTYLVSKGIDGGRLELQSYGADWARVEAEAGKSEGKNRRVQIWLH